MIYENAGHPKWSKEVSLMKAKQDISQKLDLDIPQKVKLNIPQKVN